MRTIGARQLVHSRVARDSLTTGVQQHSSHSFGPPTHRQYGLLMQIHCVCVLIGP